MIKKMSFMKRLEKPQLKIPQAPNPPPILITASKTQGTTLLLHAGPAYQKNFPEISHLDAQNNSKTWLQTYSTTVTRHSTRISLMTDMIFSECPDVQAWCPHLSWLRSITFRSLTKIQKNLDASSYLNTHARPTLKLSFKLRPHPRWTRLVWLAPHFTSH